MYGLLYVCMHSYTYINSYRHTHKHAHPRTLQKHGKKSKGALTDLHVGVFWCRVSSKRARKEMERATRWRSMILKSAISSAKVLPPIKPIMRSNVQYMQTSLHARVRTCILIPSAQSQLSTIISYTSICICLFIHTKTFACACVCVTLHLTQYGDNCRWEACTTNHRKSETRRQGVGPCTASSCNVESLNRTCHCSEYQVWWYWR